MNNNNNNIDNNNNNKHNTNTTTNNNNNRGDGGAHQGDRGDGTEGGEEIRPKILKILENLEILIFWGKFLDFFWKSSNYNFQSKRQILTSRGVYNILYLKYSPITEM